MAYNIKYRFCFESIYAVYEVRLLEDGYSGSVINRALGKAPVIRMQEADPFRPTCCELTLECQTDGEYVDLYTTDPNQFKVEVYHKRGGSSYTMIWNGFVATELYSEPDIAPPYDVRITATDGLGILKEHIFEGAGLQPVRKHLRDILMVTGDSRPYIYTASRLREYGETDNDFMDVVEINLDYMVGKNYYEVLGELLRSMRCIITFRGGYWLIIRQVDVQITSSGALSVLFSDYDQSEATTDTTLNLGKIIGKKGASGTDMWPVGYLTRSVVPAKNAVKVTAEWNLKDGSPDLEDWSGTGEYTTGAAPRYLGTLGGTGSLYSVMSMLQFTTDIKVTVKCWRGSVWQNYNGEPYIKILAMYQSSGGTTKYYHPDTGWTTDSPGSDDEHPIDQTNSRSDPNLAQEISVTIPGPNDSNSGNLSITVVGHLAAIYDVNVELVTMKGYEDNIVIDNGARGAAEALSITGGREISSFLIGSGFAYGVWSNSDTHQVITSFSDGSRIDKDWMSLTALAYAKEYATPRIEITGKLDNPYTSPMQLPPMFVKSHGVWALVSTYDWDMQNEDVDFKAVTLPTALLSVTSETITSMAGNNGTATSSGGGGSSRETDPVFSSSPASGITNSDIINWRGLQGLPSLEQSDNGKSLVAVDGLWEKGRILPSVSSSDNGKVLKVVSGVWTKGTDDTGYVKPSNGIPSSDMEQAVQTSLGKADSALQSVPSDYKKVVECANQAAYEAITPKDSGTLYVIPETQ